MSIERRVVLVEKLFHQLEQETTKFTQTTGIGCVSGCGKCCTSPHVEASPLEFLPWAFHLFLNGEAEKMLASLNENQSATCIIYKALSISGKGSCSNYKYRGLICRLFGFAANTAPQPHQAPHQAAEPPVGAVADRTTPSRTRSHHSRRNSFARFLPNARPPPTKARRSFREK